MEVGCPARRDFFLAHLVALLLTKLEAAVMPTLCQLALYIPHFHCCSAAQSCPPLCTPMDCSTPGFPVLHYLLEFAQTHVHGASDVIQPSCLLLLLSLPPLNLSQHQGLFQTLVIRISEVPSLFLLHECFQTMY